MDVRDTSVITEYLRMADLSKLPGWNAKNPFSVLSLAHGEYNLNYLIRQGNHKWVFRVNLDTQIGREDQIEYEYLALCLLAGTHLTPQPYFVDDSRDFLPNGVLIMEYLPGESLNYRLDLEAAARLFAWIHTGTSHLENHHLIVEENPLSMTYHESDRLLQVYFDSEVADPEICAYLQEVIAWADDARSQEAYFFSDRWSCLINTEVNSGNFIANRQKGSLHLVDWEKPLWGDPSQDLSHFCVATTTLWKSDYQMLPEDREKFLNAYRAAVKDPHLRDTIEDRVRLRDPFNCLRGISWSAMAWVTYQSGAHALQNRDTFQKIGQYLQMDFLQSLFGDILK